MPKTSGKINFHSLSLKNYLGFKIIVFSVFIHHLLCTNQYKLAQSKLK